MHQSAYSHMERAFRKYFRKTDHHVLLDVGSRAVSGHKLTHRQIIEGSGLRYIGVDVVDGPNVDLVMKKPYRLPARSNSVDLIFCGQVFEHVPYFWVTIMEMARVVRPGGLIFITAPSRGHRHSPPTDCWRFYPDGMLAMAAFARLRVLEAHTDFPPKTEDGKRLDYSKIDRAHYWGDTLGVFEKPADYPSIKSAIIREALVLWANNLPPVRGDVAPQRS